MVYNLRYNHQNQDFEKLVSDLLNSSFKSFSFLSHNFFRSIERISLKFFTDPLKVFLVDIVLCFLLQETVAICLASSQLTFSFMFLVFLLCTCLFKDFYKHF